MLSLLLTILASAVPEATCQSPLVKGLSQEIPLASDSVGGFWGLSTRTADHATVAMNGLGDVLVAFHSDRTGYPNTSYGLKQVEAALYKYDSVNDAWAFTERYLLGSVTVDPLPLTPQSIVKCERPDVIAVDNAFFVVWTRRYDRSFSGQAEEPAVLECAWLTPSSGSYVVHNNSLGLGAGVPIIGGYWIRECAGVPDAVVLDPGSTTTPASIGIAYVHQSDFGDDLGNNDATRLCDLRFVVCEISPANVLSTPAAPVNLISNVLFNGDTAPPPAADSAGLIVPDCAPANGTFRFWLAYEEQLSQVPGNSPDGRVRLKLYERDATGAWVELAGHTFGSSSALFGRRRPNLSSYPAGSSGVDVVSIAFAKVNTPDDGDVLYEQWVYDEPSGLFRLTLPLGIGFPNNPGGVVVDDRRPVPLHGRNSPSVRRCYVDRTFTSSDNRITRYDLGTNATTDLATSATGIGRPAVSYWFNPFASRDDVALSYEKVISTGPNVFRIFLHMD